MIILETKNLQLREFTVHDAPFILELLNTPSWIRFIGDRNVKSIDDARNYILNGPVNSYAKNGFGLYLLELKSDHIPIGMCGLIKRDSLEDVDIGFALMPECQNKGYGFESASAILNDAKIRLGINRIVAITTHDNVNSIHLLEKLGMHFEKTVNLLGDPEELLLFSIVTA